MRSTLWFLLLVAACTDGETDETGPDDTGETAAPSVCEALGLSERAFVDAQPTAALLATASDLGIPTTEGDWSLAGHWTGCDLHLFVQDHPRQNGGLDETRFWSRDVDDLLARSPRNVHWFFVSTESSSQDREASLATIQTAMADALADLPAEDQAWWPDRIHYIPVRHVDLPDWLGDLMASGWGSTAGWGVGIDRFQRIRFIGSYADPERPNASAGWYDPNLSMAANEAIYWNFEADREDRLAAQDVEVIRLFDAQTISDPSWEGERAYVEVDLPDAATMTGFDAMELDLVLDCVGDGEYGTCPAWDYIDWLWLCDAGAPDTCSQELGRWITTYHREGRWVHDVSPLLPLLAQGGNRRFAFYSQQEYAVTLDLRLVRAGRSTRPTQVTHLFSGGHFGETYNDAYAPVLVDIPAGAKAVKLATVLSGHGMSSPGNCAEFCDTEHHFGVNGTDNLLSFPNAGSTWGCMETVGEGTVPNQYGTWWYGRGGWCPGREVPMTVTDVTAQVTPGTTATFTYQAFYRDEPYPGTGAEIRLEAWVVVEE
ncbi:MAG: hypothetical protein JXB39_14730 [Deltaproteobacteria bacterium]|nr:hypothetical protein [Deltaproteobacteria bacterium]